MIHRHAGIALNPSKRSMVHSRLSRRLRVLGRSDFSAYLDELETCGRDVQEWQAFVNALTTNLTAFFREAHHFPVLAQHLRQRADAGTAAAVVLCGVQRRRGRTSMAMTALDCFDGQPPPLTILATDIDTAVLDKARQGVYPLEAAGRLDPSLLRRHFLRGRGASAGLARVRPELAAPISFRQLNLLDTRWPMPTRFDAIFCRNVMIYFDKPTQRRLLERLAGHLKPGGLLFAGHSENLTQARDLFEPQGKTVYRLAKA